MRSLRDRPPSAAINGSLFTDAEIVSLILDFTPVFAAAAAAAATPRECSGAITVVDVRPILSLK